jgi:hypothetical protein
LSQKHFAYLGLSLADTHGNKNQNKKTFGQTLAMDYGETIRIDYTLLNSSEKSSIYLQSYFSRAV